MRGCDFLGVFTRRTPRTASFQTKSWSHVHLSPRCAVRNCRLEKFRIVETTSLSEQSTHADQILSAIQACAPTNCKGHPHRIGALSLWRPSTPLTSYPHVILRRRNQLNFAAGKKTSLLTRLTANATTKTQNVTVLAAQCARSKARRLRENACSLARWVEIGKLVVWYRAG